MIFQISLQTLVILLLIAYIIGLISGVNMGKPGVY